MREFLKKMKDYPITLVFFALLILLTVADLIYPDRGKLRAGKQASGPTPGL